MTRVQRDDTGAAMLIALGFITFFGLVISAVLGFSDTSLRAADTVQSQRSRVYAADAAVEKAVAEMRKDAAMGRFGGAPCGQTVPDLNGLTVSVACTPDSTSGVGGGVGAKGDAIVTTASLASGEYGVYRDANGDLPVGGNIRSNSTVELGGGGTITADGNVVAAGACDALVTVAVATPPNTRNCGAGALTPEPVYPSAAINAAAGASTPCLAPATWVKFKAGTYKSAAALSGAMSSLSLCTKSVFYFEPGTYYFDFPAGDDEWVVNDANVNILGGVPVDTVAVPTDSLAPATPRPLALPFPGACKTTASGVQFVFGGTSRLRVEAGTIELCPASGLGTAPPIAVYGSTNTAAAPFTLTPTGSAGTTSFTDVSKAFTIGDGGTAKAALGRNQTGTLTLTGFNQTPIPESAVIQSVTVRVRHQEGNNGGRNNNADLASGSLKLGPGTGACTFALTKQAVLATEQFDAKACLSTSAAFTGLQATYSVTVPDQNNKALDAYLDGVAVDVVYANPGAAAPRGCITETGFPKSGADAAHCALFKVSGNSSNVVLHGMLYAPRAAVDLSASSGSKQGYLRGIVARVVRANVTPSVSFPTTITVPVPVGGTPTDRLVDLVATIDGVERLRARVRFEDQPAPGTKVLIEWWDVSR